MKRVTFLIILLLSVISLIKEGHCAIISLDSSVTHQTISGWETVTLELRDMPYAFPNFKNYADKFFDTVVEVGINRIRLETHEYFHHVEETNDNNDPFDINWSGFDFSMFDSVVDLNITPLQNRLQAQGESLQVNLCTVEIGSRVKDPHHIDPDEFAEFVLAHFLHLQNKYGWVPDFVEVSLEPTVMNTFDEDPAKLGAALITMDKRLEANNFNPGIIAPSSATLQIAISWFDQMRTTPEIFDHWTEFSYHRYSGNTDANLQAIASRAKTYGLNTSMLEWWSNSNNHHVLHKDLKMGNNSAWQRATLGGIVNVDETEPSNPIITLKDDHKFIRQYYKYVREGAVRIEATSNDAGFDPLGFINTDGKSVVIVKTTMGGNFSIQNLPAGTYGIKYTVSSSEWDIDLPDITITNGEVLNTNIPSAGVITIYNKLALDRYTIVASAGNGGTINPSGNVIVNEGSEQYFAVEANEGFAISDVLVDGESVGSISTYTFNNVTKSHTIEAFFLTVNTYDLNISAVNGTVTKTPEKTSYNYGDTLILQAHPDNGYHFVSWSGDLSISTNPATIIMDSDKTITANFDVNTYSLKVNETGGSVTKIPDKEIYNHGDSVTLQAFTTNPYYFTNWSGDLSGKTNPVTIVMDSDKIITANFALDTKPTTTYGHIPDKNSIQAARDTIVQVHIADVGSGVDYKSVNIRMGGNLVYDGSRENSNGVFNSTDGICRRVGTASDYTFVFQPLVLFDFEQKVDVIVNAADKTGNIMPKETYYFYTVMRTFGKNVKVNTDTGTLLQNNPATAVDSSDNIWVVWDQTTSIGDTDIYIGRLQRDGIAFESSQLVYGGPNDQRKPAIAIDHNDKIYVVCQSYNSSGRWDLFTSVSTNGTSWISTKVNVDDPDYESDQTSPIIAIDGNNKVYICWEDNRTGNKDIWVATSSNGSPWASTPVATAANDQTKPAITIDSADTIYMVWADGRSNSSSDIYGVTSSGGWNELTIVNNSKNQTYPVIAPESAGTILHLLWIDDTPGDNDIYYAATNGLTSNPLSGSRIVDEDNTDQSFPSIAVDRRKIFACWQDARNLSGYNDHADIYFAEKTGSSFGTNILVNDDLGAFTQTSPVIATDNDGTPYMVWVDNREGNNDIYYTGATTLQPLATISVDAVRGGTVGIDSSLKVDIPAGALTSNTVLTIAKIINPPGFPINILGDFYEFSPGGLQFNKSVAITLPHANDECPGYSIYRVYWYNTETGTWSQSGITDVQHLEISSTLHVIRFHTTHFTGFVTVGSVGGDVSVVGGGGGGGGGCSISHDNGSNIVEYMLPYIFYFIVLVIIKFKDSRNHKEI